ncbi:MAG: hypothetical protein ACJ8C8_21310, partial [Microvirga sp.]
MAHPSKPASKTEPPVVELADFLAAEPEAPIAGECSVDCSVLWHHYSTARDAAELAGDAAKASAYNLLGGVCTMSLQASEAAKPFTPLMAWANGSSP